MSWTENDKEKRKEILYIHLYYTNNTTFKMANKKNNKQNPIPIHPQVKNWTFVIIVKCIIAKQILCIKKKIKHQRRIECWMERRRRRKTNKQN